MKTKAISKILAMALLATSLVGCGGFTGDNANKESKKEETTETSKGESTESETPKTVTMNMLSDPMKYDPRDMIGNDMQQIGVQMYVGLLQVDPNGELKAANAENWEINEDKTIYTFNLNKNVKWSDGKPVTAQDYVYAWTTALDPEFASESADQYYDIKNAQKYNEGQCGVEEVGVRAVDDYTLEVTMEYPNALFTEKVASVKMAPVRKDVVESYDDPREWAFTPDGLVVNGPFIMTDYKAKNTIVLEKNKNYYKADSVKLDKIEIKFIEEATTALASFKTDVIDICTTIPQAEIPGMLKEGTAQASPMLAMYYYSINLDKDTMDPEVYEALSKPEVRQALSLAIDRTLITSEVVKGGQTPAKGFVPVGITMPDGSDWTDGSDYEFVPAKQNLEKAKELLEKAGYPNGEDFPVVEIFYNTSEDHQAIAQAVQDMWKQGLGIDVTLVNKETKVFAQERRQGLFEITRSGNLNYSIVYPDLLELLQTINIDVSNEPRYSNPEYDSLIEEAKMSLDLESKLEILRKAEDIIMKDLPVIPIYNYANVVAVKDKIQGFVQDTNGIIVFEYMSVK